MRRVVTILTSLLLPATPFASEQSTRPAIPTADLVFR